MFARTISTRLAPTLAAARSFAKAAAPKAAATSASSSSSSSPSHQPLIKIFGIHARYANAAYSAASKANLLDKVEGELNSLKVAHDKSPALQGFFNNPTLSRDQKVAQMSEILGKKYSDTTNNLMVTLAGNARLNETMKVVEAFGELMKAKRGEVDAVITSAEPLSKAQTDSIVAALKLKVGKDKKVTLESVVNPEILGGLQVSIGDQFLDLSSSTKINEYSALIS